MKKQDLNGYKNKDRSEITKKTMELQKEKTQLKIELNMGKIKNTNQANVLKKNIAQLKTIANLKFLAQKSKDQKEVQSAAS